MTSSWVSVVKAWRRASVTQLLYKLVGLNKLRIVFTIWLIIFHRKVLHYFDVKMGLVASQITSLTIVYSSVYSDADQRKHQCSASLAFVWGIHRGPVNSPHKWPVTRKMFPFDDVIMIALKSVGLSLFILVTSHLKFAHQRYFYLLLLNRI